MKLFSVLPFLFFSQCSGNAFFRRAVSSTAGNPSFLAKLKHSSQLFHGCLQTGSYLTSLKSIFDIVVARSQHALQEGNAFSTAATAVVLASLLLPTILNQHAASHTLVSELQSIMQIVLLSYHTSIPHRFLPLIWMAFLATRLYGSTTSAATVRPRQWLSRGGGAVTANDNCTPSWEDFVMEEVTIQDEDDESVVLEPLFSVVAIQAPSTLPGPCIPLSTVIPQRLPTTTTRRRSSNNLWQTAFARARPLRQFWYGVYDAVQHHEETSVLLLVD